MMVLESIEMALRLSVISEGNKQSTTVTLKDDVVQQTVGLSARHICILITQMPDYDASVGATVIDYEKT